jgi:hypothetical protein
MQTIGILAALFILSSIAAGFLVGFILGGIDPDNVAMPDDEGDWMDAELTRVLKEVE